MSQHTYHPDSHEFGLADGCPRCEEHAGHPFESLDKGNLTALLERVDGKLPARSENEAIAMNAISSILVHCAVITALREGSVR